MPGRRGAGQEMHGSPQPPHGPPPDRMQPPVRVVPHGHTVSENAQSQHGERLGPHRELAGRRRPGGCSGRCWLLARWELHGAASGREVRCGGCGSAQAVGHSARRRHWCGPRGAGAGAGQARGWLLYHYLLIIVLFSLPAPIGPALSELRSANSGAQAREGASESGRGGPPCPAAQRQPRALAPPRPQAGPAPQLLVAPVSTQNSAQHIGTRKPMGTRPAPAPPPI